MSVADHDWCVCGHTSSAHPEGGFCRVRTCSKCSEFRDKDSMRAKVEHFARLELDARGLWDRGWRFRWNTTSKSFAGWCKPRHKVIEVAEWVLDHDWPWEEVKDVVLHEVAHALAPRASSHGAEWKRIAARIGADPTATYESDLPTPEKLWREWCPECGWERRVHRLARGASCPDCDGSFNPDLLLHIEASDGRAVTAKGVLRTYTRHDALDRLPPGTEGL